MNARGFVRHLDQQRIVIGLTALTFVLFALLLPGFAHIANILTMLQSVAIIGALGVAMAIVIIGRGIDLSMIANLVMPVAWVYVEIRSGRSIGWALGYGVLIATVAGIFNGVLIAYLEIPAVFATLASGTIIYGAMQFLAVSDDIVPLPAHLDWMGTLFQGSELGVPNVVIFFAATSALAWLFLRFTVYGRFIYAIGDNPLAARTTGLPQRPITVLQYVISANIALIAGAVLGATVNSVNTRLFNSTMIYDVILVVVLGGVGLSGGKGSIANVISGTLLIGVLINGMTIMNLSYDAQNLIKASMLLVAIIADSLVNPRDEQTSQHGDI